MATPYRIDQHQAKGVSQRHRPIVLAQLPYVGASVGKVEKNSVVDPIHEAAKQSSSLQPPSLQHQEATGPFSRVDLQASADANSSLDSTQQKHSSQQSNPPTIQSNTSTSHASVPELASTPLLPLYLRLAPYSGLIATLALIASAGLLYWLIVSPTQMSVDYQVGSPQGLGRTSIIIPEEKFWQLPSELSTQSLAGQVLEKQVPTDQEAEDASAAKEQSTAPEPSSPQLPQIEEGPTELPGFPNTSRPSSLDFTKLRDMISNKRPLALPEQLPSVAEHQDSLDTASTINR